MTSCNITHLMMNVWVCYKDVGELILINPAIADPVACQLAVSLLWGLPLKIHSNFMVSIHQPGEKQGMSIML